MTIWLDAILTNCGDRSIPHSTICEPCILICIHDTWTMRTHTHPWYVNDAYSYASMIRERCVLICIHDMWTMRTSAHIYIWTKIARLKKKDTDVGRSKSRYRTYTDRRCSFNVCYELTLKSSFCTISLPLPGGTNLFWLPSTTRINLEEPVRVASPTRIHLEEPVRVASTTRINSFLCQSVRLSVCKG